MNILMTALQPGGGIRTFFRYIYSQPVFADHSFTLLAPDQGLSEYFSEVLPPGRIKVVPSEPEPLKFVLRLRRIIQGSGFDMVHSHGFSAGVLTELALLGKGNTHLMTAHDVFSRKQFSGVKGRLRHLGMDLAFRRMSAIHTVTEDAGANLLEFFTGIDPGRVEFILHGIDATFFRDGVPVPLKESLGLEPDTPLIGFFGRFMGQKGFRVLVQALRKIREKRLLPVLPHVATFGWGGFIREDYAFLDDLGLSDYFHQIPQTDNMPGALKGVDLVAMPSRWEACGLLAMEALAAGVPIVGSNCIGLREVLDGSPALQVPVGDSEALADELVAELTDIKKRKMAFLAYQSEAVERFGIERPATELLALYRKLLARE